MTAVLDSTIVAAQQIDVGKIRELRTAAGLTLAEAAAKAGIPGGASSWGDIESGRRGGMKFGTLVAIATVFKCDVRELITPPGPKPKRKGGAK